MIRVGIVSFAHMHANGYAWALNELHRKGEAVKFVAIADSDANRANLKAKEFGAEKVFADYRQMLDGDTVDAVIICSENARHAGEIEDATKAGKHILCEKPIGATANDLKAIRTAVGASDVVFQTAFVCRFSPAVMEAKRAVDTGEFGAIKAISATNHGSCPHDWFVDSALSGGGAIIDHTVHAADVIRLLTGEELTNIRAFPGKNIRSELSVEDNAMIYARSSKTDIPVSIDCSWSRHENVWPTWGDLTLTLLCERGVLKIDAFRAHIKLANKAGFKWHGLGEDLNEKLMRSFVRSIEEKRGQATGSSRPSSADDPTWRAGVEDGARAAEVALAAYQSIGKHSAAVSV